MPPMVSPMETMTPMGTPEMSMPPMGSPVPSMAMPMPTEEDLPPFETEMPTMMPTPSPSEGTCATRLTTARYVMCGKHFREKIRTKYGDIIFRLVVKFGRFEGILISKKRNIESFGMAITADDEDPPSNLTEEEYGPDRKETADVSGETSVEDLKIGADVRQCCGQNAATVWYQFTVCASYESSDCETIEQGANFDIRCRPICRGSKLFYDLTMNYTAQAMSFKDGIKCPNCLPPVAGDIGEVF